MSLLSLVTYRVPALHVDGIEHADWRFVYSNWFKPFRRSQWAGTVPNHRYHEVMKDVFTGLESRGMRTLLLVNKEDTEQLLGFVCYELSVSGVVVVHWLYVKEDFRQQGLATALLQEVGVRNSFIYTHRTEDSKYFINGKFVPAIARRKELEPVYGPNTTKNSKFQLKQPFDSEQQSR